MTVSGGDADVHGRLAAALRTARGASIDDVDGLRFEYPLTLMPDELADALLPVVEQIRAEAEDAAYEDGAADALYGITAELLPHESVSVAELRAEAERARDRATALRAHTNTSETDNQPTGTSHRPEPRDPT